MAQNHAKAVDMKQTILENLKVLRNIEKTNGQKFKVIAYSKVIKQLETHDKPITSVEDLQSISGIGKGIKEKIEEIIKSGYTEKTKEALDKTSAQGAIMAAMESLTQIMGVGPVKAKELIEQHKIVTIDELRNRLDLLNDKQRMGLKYHDDFMKRIPRAEMDKHFAFIEDAVKSADKDLIFEMTGSYRRGLKDSGDIDVLVTYRGDNVAKAEAAFRNIIEHLRKKKYLADDFAFGDKKYNGVCRLPRHRSYRRIDIMYTEPERFPFALLYFTGSQDFNIGMRKKALELGYSLNEYGLKETGGKKDDTIAHQFHTEQDVFKFLGMEYVAPKDRVKVMS